MHSAEKGETAGKLLEPGDMFGDYTVEELLGKGGMGAVYRVRAPGGERYAVKVMFPDMVKKGSAYRKRFAREAEFAMKIRHKNLISVYDVGEDPETGLCYIIMDYVPGGSVADRLERCGRFSITEAVSIVAQVALALEVAHRHGVIHRDIKPENIMFDADGTPKLADLGVAKFTGSEHKTTVTTTGMIIGTPAYMAPEQMMDSHNIDARADIYALGIVLYEMLAGKRPTEGSTAVELLAKALKGESLPDVRTMRPEISAAVAHVLSLLCAPKPEGRPSTALEAADLLRKAATGRLVLPKKSPRAADAAARKKKRSVSTGAIVAVAVVFFVYTVLLIVLLCKQHARPTASLQPVITTNVVARTVMATNLVERHTVATNIVSHEARDAFLFKLPAPKFPMAVHEDVLGWFKRDGNLPSGTAIRVCHDLSHGGFPVASRFFYNTFLLGKNGFAIKPCWHDLTSENLESVNILVLPPSPAQILYSKDEATVIGRFLAMGGTVVAFADADGNNLWSMNKFFAEYGLEVFAMDEFGAMGKEKRAAPCPAVAACSAMMGLKPELRLTAFAAPLDEVGAREWSAMVRAGREDRAVMAARRVGKGVLVFVSSGWYWYKTFRDERYSQRPVTSDDNKLIWTRLFVSAAQNRPIGTSVPIGERSSTDSPVVLPTGPITIYSAERWGANACKLQSLVRLALPILERYCGGSLDPSEMKHTKYVLTGTSIWGYVDAGPKTLATSATFRGFPDKIGYLSEFVFKHLVLGSAGDNGIDLSGYIANRALADMGFPGELTSRIKEGRHRDSDFTKYRLTNGTTLQDKDGNMIQDGRDEIVCAKNFSALEEIRARHPDFIPAFIARKKNVYGQLSSSQSIGILTDVTGEDCFKIFEKYGVVCSREDAVIAPERLIKPTTQGIARESAKRNDDGTSELKGPYGLVIKAGPGCEVAAKKLLSELEHIWLPAAMKFYGDPYQGRKPERSFVVTLERSDHLAYRPGLNEWRGFLPHGRDDFNISLDYLCAAALTKVAEPSWVDFAFYADRFLSDTVYGRHTAVANIQQDIKTGKEAEGNTHDDYSSFGKSQWAAQMKRRWKLWVALEEVRAKDEGFMLKYCNIKNQRYAEGKIAANINWRQMAELMGEAVGFDVVEIFERNGVEMPQAEGLAQKEHPKEKPSHDARKTKAMVVFPCADPGNTKWKSRAPWRYVTQYPVPSGGKMWTDPAFRDSGWKRTSKPLGVGKNKEIMRIADRWSSSSVYLRRHFSWRSIGVARVEFTLYHACNVKIYLNGILVLEKGDRNEWWEKIEVPAETFMAALREGDNVLAVEAQDNFGVRYFDCGLTIEVEDSK